MSRILIIDDEPSGDADAPGIMDVHSGAEGNATDGRPYAEL